MRTAVLGVGNILLSDDGVGVRVIEALRDGYTFSGEMECIDGGTMGLDLLPFIEGKKRLLIVDAVNTGRPPGTLIRIENGDIPKFLGQKLSVHQIGLPEMLSAAALMSILPEEICLIGMQPGRLATGLDLSGVVSARFNDLVAAVVTKLSEWGIEARERPVVSVPHG
jgi:hydrogenase maturation protease